MNFPNMSEVKASYVKSHHPPIVLSNGEHIIFNKLQKQRMKARTSRAIPYESIKKLNAARDKKCFGSTNNFGSLDEGQELKVIKNYAGCNTMYENDTRKLVRKDGRLTMMNLSSSLPEWLPPGVYENIDPEIARQPIVQACVSSFNTVSRGAIDSDVAERVEDRRVEKIVTRASWDEGGVTDADDFRGLSQQSTMKQSKQKSYQASTQSFRHHVALSSSRYATDIKELVNASRQREAITEQTEASLLLKQDSSYNTTIYPQSSILSSRCQSAPAVRSTARDKENQSPRMKATLIRGFETVDLTAQDQKIADSKMAALCRRSIGSPSPLSADAHCRNIVMGEFMPATVTSTANGRPPQHGARGSKFEVKDWTMGAYPATNDVTSIADVQEHLHSEQDLLQSSVASVLSPHVMEQNGEDAVTQMKQHVSPEGLFSLVDFALLSPAKAEKNRACVRSNVRSTVSSAANQSLASMAPADTSSDRFDTFDKADSQDIGVVHEEAHSTVRAADQDNIPTPATILRSTTNKGKLQAEHLAQYKNYAPKKKLFHRSLTSAVPLSRDKQFRQAVDAAKEHNNNRAKTAARKVVSGKSTGDGTARQVISGKSTGDGTRRVRPSSCPGRPKPKPTEVAKDVNVPMTENEYISTLPLNANLAGTLKEWYTKEDIYRPLHRTSSMAAVLREEKHKAAFSCARTASQTLIRSSSTANALQGTSGILLPGPGTDVDGLAAVTTPRISTPRELRQSAILGHSQTLHKDAYSTVKALGVGLDSSNHVADVDFDIDPEVVADEAYWVAHAKARVAAKRRVDARRGIKGNSYEDDDSIL